MLRPEAEIIVAIDIVQISRQVAVRHETETYLRGAEAALTWAMRLTEDTAFARQLVKMMERMQSDAVGPFADIARS